MQQSSPEVLARQIPEPEEEKRYGNNPVGEHGREHRFERGHRRARFTLPPEMSPHQPHQVPLAVLFEGLPVRKNRWKHAHAAPKTQQEKMKTQGEHQKDQRTTKIKPRHGKQIPETSRMQ